MWSSRIHPFPLCVIQECWNFIVTWVQVQNDKINVDFIFICSVRLALFHDELDIDGFNNLTSLANLLSHYLNIFGKVFLLKNLGDWCGPKISPIRLPNPLSPRLGPDPGVAMMGPKSANRFLWDLALALSWIYSIFAYKTRV